MLSRRCFSIPMEFSPREILLIYLIADLNKNFIIHSLASILHVHNFTCPLSRVICSRIEIIFNHCSRLYRSSFIIFGKRSLPVISKKNKNKKRFLINVYKKDSLQSRWFFNIFFKVAASLRNFYLTIVVYYKKLLTWKS